MLSLAESVHADNASSTGRDGMESAMEDDDDKPAEPRQAQPNSLGHAAASGSCAGGASARSSARDSMRARCSAREAADDDATPAIVQGVLLGGNGSAAAVSALAAPLTPQATPPPPPPRRSLRSSSGEHHTRCSSQNGPTTGTGNTLLSNDLASGPRDRNALMQLIQQSAERAAATATAAQAISHSWSPPYLSPRLELGRSRIDPGVDGLPTSLWGETSSRLTPMRRAAVAQPATQPPPPEPPPEPPSRQRDDAAARCGLSTPSTLPPAAHMPHPDPANPHSAPPPPTTPRPHHLASASAAVPRASRPCTHSASRPPCQPPVPPAAVVPAALIRARRVSSERAGLSLSVSAPSLPSDRPLAPPFHRTWAPPSHRPLALASAAVAHSEGTLSTPSEDLHAAQGMPWSDDDDSGLHVDAENEDSDEAVDGRSSLEPWSTPPEARSCAATSPRSDLQPWSVRKTLSFPSPGERGQSTSEVWDASRRKPRALARARRAPADSPDDEMHRV